MLHLGVECKSLTMISLVINWEFYVDIEDDNPRTLQYLAGANSSTDIIALLPSMATAGLDGFTYRS